MICRFSPEAERRELTPVDNLFITEFLPDADGQDVCVYLYGLMQCYHPSMRDTSISEALSIPESRVQRAFVYWQSKGLCTVVGDEPLIVEYKGATIQEATTATPAKYPQFIRSLNALLAPRELLLRELKYVNAFIEEYGMEEGAVMELFSFCIQQKSKRVSIGYINTVAMSWCERGILTADQASQYISDYNIKAHGASEVLARWNKRRKPTHDEMDMYDRWVGEWGFDTEAILAACPQVVVAGTPTFAVLNDMLSALHAKNMTTKDDILSNDKSVSSDKEFTRLVFARLGKVEPPTQSNIAQIGVFVHQMKIPQQVILLAADACATAERPLGYLKAILKDWADKGINSIPLAEKALVERENGKNTSNKGKRVTIDYKGQRAPNSNDVAARFVNLDEDI
ncbi:MAG: DnaD domain protein [Eubacteriales bacterium]|nr:DnaD domain protein [Eubacteriales bacterium]